jgi:hypothetical protein
MKNRLLVAALSFAAMAPSHADTPLDTKNKQHTVTWDYLMESCSVVGETAGGMLPHFDCESYLYGVVDSYAATRASLNKPSQICLPPKLAAWEIYQHLLAAPRATGQQPAAALIIKTLALKYPCK